MPVLVCSTFNLIIITVALVMVHPLGYMLIEVATDGVQLALRQTFELDRLPVTTAITYLDLGAAVGRPEAKNLVH